jgi:hypothetical protein
MYTNRIYMATQSALSFSHVPLTHAVNTQNLFKRPEKLAQHIRAFHTEITEGQDINGGISSRERDASLITNNAANAGNHFEGDDEQCAKKLI